MKLRIKLILLFVAMESFAGGFSPQQVDRLLSETRDASIILCDSIPRWRVIINKQLDKMAIIDSVNILAIMPNGDVKVTVNKTSVFTYPSHTCTIDSYYVIRSLSANSGGVIDWNKIVEESVLRIDR